MCEVDCVSSTRKRILIVEDKQRHYTRWQAALDEVAECTIATSIDEARDAFARGQFDLIILDACVPGDHPTTPPLAREFRETFSGPMVAASSSYGYCEMLRHAGCDYFVDHRGKLAVPEIVLAILFAQPAADH